MRRERDPRDPSVHVHLVGGRKRHRQTLFAPVSGEGYLYVEAEDAVGNSDTDQLYITIDLEAKPMECVE